MKKANILAWILVLALGIMCCNSKHPFWPAAIVGAGIIMSVFNVLNPEDD